MVALAPLFLALALISSSPDALQLRQVFRAGEPNVHGFNVSCFRIP
jgi:hypothetical protein